MLFATIIAALGAAAAVFFLLPPNAEAEAASISGTVAYRERIALPPQAQVEVKLVDISLMDAPSTTIAEIVIEPKGQVPIPFTISYDAALIQAGRTYALQARITADGRLIFITDQIYPVMATDDGPTDLLLKRVGAEGQ
jgi:putative lipoprotein